MPPMRMPSQAGSGGAPGGTDPSLADVIERLFRDFEDRLPLGRIVEIVRECRDSTRAEPRLVEWLVRQRLHNLPPDDS